MEHQRPVRPRSALYERRFAAVSPQARPQPVRPAPTPVISAQATAPPTKAISLKLRPLKFRILSRTRQWAEHFAHPLTSRLNPKRRQALSRFFGQTKVRVSLVVVIAVLIASDVFPMFQGQLGNKAYALGDSGKYLTAINQQIADKIKLDNQGTYNFNQGYTPPTGSSASATGTQITATAAQDPTKGLTVTDPVHSSGLGFTPTFDLLPGKQDGNRIVYPLRDGSGWLVYTMHAVGVKEDLLLTESKKDVQTFTYKLKLQDGLVARAEADGSLGVYGDTLLSGNVTTASDSDAALLQKARQNSQKTTLMFTIPAPTIQGGHGTRAVKAKYRVAEGNQIELIVSGLKQATYPLDIDPSVYVTSASQFMRGNNETNISFDSADDLILKGKTTGARINSWTAGTAMNNAAWGQGTAVMGGYVYSVGGIQGGGKSTYYTNGSNNFVVPTGVTSITVRAWGAGGGGGSGSGSTGSGGGGGGGGFTKATITTTPSETLTVLVGSGGAASAGSSRAGSGGGYSAVKRSTTFLVQAGGGGGGGGGIGTGNGGDGGAGGGTNGSAGKAGDTGSGTGGGGGGGGTGGTNGTAGSAGTGGVAGVAGAANAGGNGGGFGGTCSAASGTGGAGGTGAGGAGGNDTSTCSNGGGGGGGRAGGAGGGSTTSANTGAGGGGGGSDLVTGTNTQETAGSGTSAGNYTDPLNNGAGAGGDGVTTATGAAAGTDGAVVITYTVTTAGVSNTVSWAHFNTSTNAIESPNPGTGTCTGWCTSTAYNLPASLTDLCLVGYNGFLYAIGGADSSGVAQTSVYIAKIGANGEPQLWTPNGGAPSYWYTDTALPAARTQFAAVASNNHMYILGGLTSGTPANTLLSSNTVQYASITPTGTLSAFTATGMQALTATYGLSAQVYNNVIYAIGGDTSFNGTPSTAVSYAHLNSDGTMNAWQTGTTMAVGRIAGGGNFSTIWGGYIYVAGGCSSVTAAVSNAYCQTMASDVELASINADGSLDAWNAILGLDNTYIGQTVTAWQNGLYRLGGCGSESTTAKVCNDPLPDTAYGVVNQDGDASTVATSVASGTAPCSGTTPTNCNLPATTTIGQALNATAVMNGFLYVFGGCTSTACSAMSANVIYSAISSTGALSKPTTCTSGTFSGTWCIDTTDTITGGIGAAAVAIFSNRIYLVGGLNGTANKGSIFRTSVNANGTISAWTSQTMPGTGSTQLNVNSVSYEYAYARANPSLAATYPGNLYIFGGCTTSSAAGCTAYSQVVYKCYIKTDGSIATATDALHPCESTATQLQIGTISGASGTGLGIMAGTVYANYIYLIGGVAPGVTDLTTVRYAKFDNNNNVVAVSGSAWVVSSVTMSVGRRRAAAFGYNGYIYVVGGYDGTGGGGVLADIEFAKVNVSDGSLTDQTGGSNKFNVSSVHIGARWGLSVPISNSYAYVIGGCDTGASPTCNTMTATVQTFQVYNNDSGTAAAFGTTGTCSSTAVNGPCVTNGVDRYGTAATILNGYIYLAGGCITVTGCSTITNAVSYAPIDANGAVGAWAAGGNLPANRAWGKLLSAGGTLYYVGGQTGAANTTAQSTVYYTTGISSGNPTWGTTTKGITNTAGTAQTLTEFGAAVWNNRMYLVGGFNSGGTVQSAVLVSPQQSSGGDITSNWSSGSTSLSVARGGAAVVAYANNLYVFGGNDGTNYMSDGQYSQISTATGNAGSWTYTTSLPTPLSDGDGFAANGYIYILGGRSASTTCNPATLASPISANTTIASGNNPTGIGEWYQTNVNYTGGRYGAAATYSNGKAYIMGGACNGAFVAAANRNYSTAVLSQPQVAQYSLMIDADTDVFPTKWLLNGIDNSVGASWQLSYQSMKNTTTSCLGAAMTTWGQVTNVGNVTLGTPGTYTPKDGSGTNTSCARFFYLYVSIDASQTFGYPEDISRGPTINDLTLEFTADPSKRLMHGRTFIQGVQQPDDTPF